MQNKQLLYLALFAFSFSSVTAQTLLSADGTTDTYTLINSILAPGATAVEPPDCAHEDFGDHIDQVMDIDFNTYVFRFHIHVDEDNDRCKNEDRQRNEIKTYDQSPANLKAVDGEIVEYKWKFKLDADFQTSASFTHLHQVKAVGGSEEGMPLITLTARSDNKMQLRYAEYATQETILEVALAPFLGQWVEATERITFGENGSYKINITRISDETSVLTYENNDIRMWKTDAEFLRPKWGIYRSLNNWEDLRDETLLYNDFSIEEIDPSQLAENKEASFLICPNPSNGTFTIDATPGASLDIYDLNGQNIYTVAEADMHQLLNINLTQGTYLLNLNYTSYTLSQKLIVN